MKEKTIIFTLLISALAGGVLIKYLGFSIYIGLVWALLVGGISLIVFRRTKNR